MNRLFTTHAECETIDYNINKETEIKSYQLFLRWSQFQSKRLCRERCHRHYNEHSLNKHPSMGDLTVN